MAKSNASQQQALEPAARPARKPVVHLQESNRLPELDRLIHERMRLGIVSGLAAHPALSFNDLKSLLNTTDGNISVHARKLEEAGYISCTKRFEGRMPRTEYALTAAGRRALEKYLNHMEALIQAARAPAGGRK